MLLLETELYITSSVIRQKGESQNGCFKKAKHGKISEKSGGKKCLFFGNFGVLSFLETPVLRFAFCLITDELILSKMVNDER